MIQWLWLCSAVGAATFLPTTLLEAADASRTFDVRSNGAVPDGKTLCTLAIQQTIDQCAQAGGGIVYLPAGKWLSGTIYLESNITLWLDAGCLLQGSRDKADYARPRTPISSANADSYSSWSLIAGKNLENVTLRGDGVIDGSGDAFRYKEGPRPRGIYLEGCRNVKVQDVRLQHAGSWMQHYRLCHGLAVRGITVFNHATYNNDGLNIDSCSDVRISDCSIDSDDDAIVLKSLSKQPCRDITISNCVVSSHCNSIKMGTESGGGFQNITVSNCAIRSPRFSKATYGRDRGLAGLALEIVDGGRLDRVTVTNLTIDGVNVPIFMRLGNRGRTYGEDDPPPEVGTFRNVIVSNIVATNTSDVGCSITGLPGHPIEDVTLSNIRLHFDGGGEKELSSREIPEKPSSYPESTMFGQLPAYGLFCRHVDGLQLHNIQLNVEEPDLRHALACDDVANVTIENLQADWSDGASPLLRLTQVRDAVLRGFRAKRPLDTLLQVQGADSRDIILRENDFSRINELLLATEDAVDAVVQFHNRIAESK